MDRYVYGPYFSRVEMVPCDKLRATGGASMFNRLLPEPIVSDIPLSEISHCLGENS